MRPPAGTLVVVSLLLVSAQWAAAAPSPPQPKFWTVSRCEQTFRAHDYGLPTGEGYHFHVRQTICVGTGGPQACEWTADRQARLYSEFSVFGRTRYIGGLVRSFTLDTRAGHGLVPTRRNDRGGPRRADFYMSPASVRLLATNVTPARFKAVVAPRAASLAQDENATGCTGTS
jgi:hypothetical protein